MARILIVYESHEDPPREDVSLIRAYYPQAENPIAGVFAVEGEEDAVRSRIGRLPDWTVSSEGRLYIMTKDG